MIVIISCGKAKQNKPCCAKDMYIGAYHRLLQQYALSICCENDIYILSAKYGILSLSDIIEPYELRMGQNGSIDEDAIRMQAKQRKIENEHVIALGGKIYVNLIRTVWKDVYCPIEYLPGIGHQMKWLKEQIADYTQERLF